MGFNLFFWKKKTNKAFGKNVEPDCIYCLLNNGDDEIICQNYQGDVCKKYKYDPLKRKPKISPPMKKFTEDDFEL